MNIIDAAEAMVALEGMVAAVKSHEVQESKFAKALATLQALSRKEGIPLAIVGGLAAIHHGYERFTKDIDVVVQSGDLDILTRVAPATGLKLSGMTRKGGTNCNAKGSPLMSFPRVASPETTRLPSSPAPSNWGGREGAGYAGIAGWMETKVGSYRVQDRADSVQVIKATTSATLLRIRRRLGKAHAIYLGRFDELLEAAKEEKEQERERGRGK
jgi:hypothetical protein